MSTVARRGLRIVRRRGDREVGDAVIKFARWLRTEFDFPVRVPVYLSSREVLVSTNGGVCSAAFFGPFDRSVEPYIRIATGDFHSECALHGRDHALAGYLGALSHEVLHYQQWLRGDEFLTEDGIPEQASAIVEKYALTTDRP